VGPARIESNRADGIGVASKCPKAVSRAGIPNADGVIPACGDGPPRVAGEDSTMHVLAMPFEGSNQPGVEEIFPPAVAAGRVPEVHDLPVDLVTWQGPRPMDQFERLLEISVFNGGLGLFPQFDEFSLSPAGFFGAGDMAEGGRRDEAPAFVVQQFQVPELERAVETGRKSPTPVAGQIHGADGPGVGLEGSQASPGSHLPAADRSIAAAGENPLAVGARADGVDLVGVPPKDLPHLAGGRLLDHDRTVLGRQHLPFSIPCGQAPGRVPGDLAERADLAPPGGIPELHGGGVFANKLPAAVGADGPVEVAAGGAEAGGHLPAVRVAQAEGLFVDLGQQPAVVGTQEDVQRPGWQFGECPYATGCKRDQVPRFVESGLDLEAAAKADGLLQGFERGLDISPLQLNLPHRVGGFPIKRPRAAQFLKMVDQLAVGNLAGSPEKQAAIVGHLRLPGVAFPCLFEELRRLLRPSQVQKRGGAVVESVGLQFSKHRLGPRIFPGELVAIDRLEVVGDLAHRLRPVLRVALEASEEQIGHQSGHGGQNLTCRRGLEVIPEDLSRRMAAPAARRFAKKHRQQAHPK